MEVIMKSSRVVGFANTSKDVKRFLPDKSPDSFRMIGGTDRELSYIGDGVFTILKSSKKIGQSEGDVCSLCHMGVLQNQGGCFTCSNCNAQLKCGL